MATRKAPAPKAGKVTGQFAASVEQRETLDVFTDNYYEYGMLTIEDRSLPDYRDGLLKVHRRTLFAASILAPNTKPHVKSARVVGDTIGKYHPHGDAPVYSAIQTMVHTPLELIDGAGNWGTHTDNAAAMRYTNCRLSEFSQNQLFDPDYMTTTQYHPNYDGKDEEPVLLPSLLPTILMVGITGIAVGMNTTIPAFAKEGVTKLVKGMLQGRKLTAAACYKNLEFAFGFGGNVPKVDFNEPAIHSIFDTGKGSVYTYCDYEIDKASRSLIITGVPPLMKQETLMAKLLDTEFFTRVYESTGRDSADSTRINLVGEFKRGINLDECHDWLYEKVLYSKLSFNMNVIERYWDDEANKIKAHVYQWGVVTLLENWLGWRKELEALMLVEREKRLLAEINRKSLLMIAQENRKVIASSWEADDQKAFIKAKLKLDTDEDAAYICGLRNSQLGKSDRDKLQAEINQLEVRVKETRHDQKNIEASILKQL